MLYIENGLKTLVFQTTVEVLVGSGTLEGFIPISARLPTKSAFSRFILIDGDTAIATVADQDEFHRFLKECRGKRSAAFSIVGSILAIPVYLIDLITSIIRGILGSFVGFGLIGIAIVLVALAASLMVGLYGFIIAAPFIVAGMTLSFFERKMYREAGAKFLRYLVNNLEDGYTGDLSVIRGLESNRDHSPATLEGFVEGT